METQTRRKVTGGVRSWVVVTEQGQSQVEEVGKHSLMRRTGLPPRDLRLLDPLLSYPSSILGRDQAIVVNLEHIRAIITPKEVLMVNSTNPLLSQFRRDLCHRISRSSEPSPPPPQDPYLYDSGKDESPKAMLGMIGAEGPRVMPFEFRALEACLESACRFLETETCTLEEEAYPALDELTSKISTLNLERVRQIKSRLVTLSGRVQKVRDEIEHLLDDDNDMAEMYLTEKLISRSMDQIPPREGQESESAEGNLLFDLGDDERSEESKSDQGTTAGLKPDVQELEMLLEAYFAQIDGILQKLSDMNDYVDDTEDCINIMLDDKQNQLLRMGVMLATANMILNAGIVVVGLFGMNISISLFEGDPGLKFWETTAGTVLGSFVFFLIVVGWGRKRNILAF